ncbi:porin [Acinetobacter sp. ANC 3882]|uniref:porin n=1 Tax=Acinetobacter sp. ANC 3882 TaxID=2923423 RepID=UPI001F4AB0FE|nr:porin [Acinetobacter sp. ANC 3882]MCH7314356.1 porin [Acinetobacter sp. ANC 3882]
MKLNLLSFAMLSFLSSAIYAAPTLYGEIDASIDYLPEKNANSSNKDVWEISSNSSYLGLKGDEKLTERLSAVYGIEWGFSADGDSNDWVQRNRFVGLKDTQLGTIKVGKHDTPVKQLSNTVDIFNNYVANKADIGGILVGENRIDNVVVYESPAISLTKGVVKFNALLASGESSGIKTSSGGAKVAGRGLGDAWSASLVYEHPFFVAGLGYDKAIPSTFAGRGFLNVATGQSYTADTQAFAAANTLRAIGRLNPIEGLSIKTLYQRSEVEETTYADLAEATKWATKANNIDDAQGWLVGAEYILPNAKKWILKAQYSQNDTSFKNNMADFKAKQIMAGADYAFSKQVKSYAYGGYLTLEQADKKDRQPVVGVGLEFKF